MIELGIDQMTVIFSPSPVYSQMNAHLSWENQAKDLIHIVEEKSRFEELLGKKQEAEKPPYTYTKAFTYGDHSFYLAIGYHPDYSNIGCALTFSAQGLAYYLGKAACSLYEYLQRLQSIFYDFHLSRVDLTADYYNEPFTITEIYDDWLNHKISIAREYTNDLSGLRYYKLLDLQVNGFITGSDVSTIYVGSKQSKAQLTIYDKRLEQFQRTGPYFEKASNCNSWIRFEAEFHGSYAHQITDHLLNLHSDLEYADMIASILYQKFRFVYVDDGTIIGDTLYSEMLANCISKSNYALKSATNKNYDLARSFVYQLQGSGLMAALGKSERIWGKDCLPVFEQLFKEEYRKHLLNHDAQIWLVKNKQFYQERYPEVADFISDIQLILRGDPNEQQKPKKDATGKQNAEQGSPQS